jgi:DNA replication and repair protein RecF
LQITTLSLVQFRNYREASFRFDQRVVGISGPNGVGKTNLLDAIHFLSFTRSYFSRTDAGSVQTGTAGFRIQGVFRVAGAEHEVVCILRETGKKEIMVDGEPVGRFSRHIGRFPVVFIAPDDIALVSEGAEERRKFIDTLLSQLSEPYLHDLIRYQKLLQERNGLLRNMQSNFSADPALIEVLDDQLAVFGSRIYQARRDFLLDFSPEIAGMYGQIAGGGEAPDVRYQSGLKGKDFRDMLREGLRRDLAAGRTLSGVHRDDIELSLSGMPFRQTASQGQRKSLLFAFKLAEFTRLRDAKGFPPLLLLDDVFEKLDAGRMENLLQWVCTRENGQVFLTDTHDSRIRAVMDALGVPCQMIGLTA